MSRAGILHNQTYHFWAGIWLISGPMFSGKTETLISLAQQATEAGFTVCALKPILDNRYHATRIVSHSGLNIEAQPVYNAQEIPALCQSSEVVVIDEAQFFDARLPVVCEQLAKSGKQVVLCGLDLDYRGLPFGPMPALAQLAQQHTQFTATCSICNQPATFTFRKTQSAEQFLLGQQEHYEARCKTCYTSGNASV